VLMSSRDVTIEDLNSTNGVLVNGRKISRQLLHDMDVVTIGEAQFKVSVKLAPSAADAAPPSPAR
ncbi:MAG: FHA domain-containing protein, partial [Pseudomonadota bacterium]|nr:FHA domain-containing protein [Pseudomonadota bacterium]